MIHVVLGDIRFSSGYQKEFKKASREFSRHLNAVGRSLSPALRKMTFDRNSTFLSRGTSTSTPTMLFAAMLRPQETLPRILSDLRTNPLKNLFWLLLDLLANLHNSSYVYFDAHGGFSFPYWFCRKNPFARKTPIFYSLSKCRQNILHHYEKTK